MHHVMTAWLRRLSWQCQEGVYLQTGERKTEKKRNIVYHFVAASHEHRDRSGIRALLNHQHLLPSSAKAHLSYDSCPPQLCRAEILEPGHYPAIGRNSDELNLGSTNPPDSRKLVLQE